VAKQGDGGYVGNAPACYGSSLGSNPDISQKHKMGDIRKGVANTHSTKKNVWRLCEQNIWNICEQCLESM
jgi:hypothetical protein